MDYFLLQSLLAVRLGIDIHFEADPIEGPLFVFTDVL